MAMSQHAYSRIAKKVQAPLPHASAPWTPPAMNELIARIESALMARRAS